MNPQFPISFSVLRNCRLPSVLLPFCASGKFTYIKAELPNNFFSKCSNIENSQNMFFRPGKLQKLILLSWQASVEWREGFNFFWSAWLENAHLYLRLIYTSFRRVVYSGLNFFSLGTIVGFRLIMLLLNAFAWVLVHCIDCRKCIWVVGNHWKWPHSACNAMLPNFHCSAVRYSALQCSACKVHF